MPKLLQPRTLETPYLAKRSLARMEAAHNNAEVFLDKMTRTYEGTMEQLVREMASWFIRYGYGKETGITYSQARVLLKAKDRYEYELRLTEILKAVERESDSKYRDQVTAEIKAALEVPKIGRLDSIHYEMQSHLSLLSLKEMSMTQPFLQGEYLKSFYHTVYDMQHGMGVGVSFVAPSYEDIAMAVNYPWSGAMFTDRIWDNNRYLISAVKSEITEGIVKGYGVDEMARNFRDRVGVGLSKAKTVVRTETSYVVNAADMEGYKASLGVEEYAINATLDNRTSSICRQQDGKHYPVEKAIQGVNMPPFHPNCRTCTVPYFEGEYDFAGTRIAKDADGKYYYVPGDMTYEQWENQYADDAKAVRKRIES